MPDFFTFQRIKKRRRQEGVEKRRLTKPPKWLYPHNIERAYKRHLLGYAKAVESTVNEIIVPELPALVDAVAANRPDSADRADIFNWATEVDELVEASVFALEPEFDATIALVDDFAFRASEFNQAQWSKIMRSVLGVDVFVSELWLEPLVASWRRENVKLIKNISDKALDDIEGAVQRGLRSGQRHEELAKTIATKTGYAKKRSQIIARDQISKLNGNLTHLRQQDLGIKSYVWQTSLDERVLPSHAANEGEEYKWNDSPATGHPGEDILCRCTASPVFASSSGLADL